MGSGNRTAVVIPPWFVASDFLDQRSYNWHMWQSVSFLIQARLRGADPQLLRRAVHRSRIVAIYRDQPLRPRDLDQELQAVAALTVRAAHSSSSVST